MNQLSELNLRWNDLTGSIPEELGLLTQLQQLNLGGNRLTGSIPTELGQLTELTELYLFFNELSGTIPPELGRLTQLSALNLGGNRLTGPIPAELGQLTELAELWLYGNNLIGPIPEEFALLAQLENLSISNNQLTGTIPWSLWDRSGARWVKSLLFGQFLGRGFRLLLPAALRTFPGTATENGKCVTSFRLTISGSLDVGVELGTTTLSSIRGRFWAVGPRWPCESTTKRRRHPLLPHEYWTAKTPCLQID